MLKYLQMFPETKTAVARYQPTDRCLLYEAMMDYAFTGEEPSWSESDIKWYVWELLRQAVDRTAEAIKKKQNAGNASAQQRSEAQSNTAQQNATEVNTLQQTSTQRNTEQQNAHTESESNTDTDKETDNRVNTAQARREHAKEQLALFNRFWDAYPRKIAKQNAVKAFGKLDADEALLETMLAAIEKQKKSPQWSDPQYIPHPATWLNGHRWEDEVQQSTGNSRTAQTNYAQRSYEEPKPDELPDWYIKMMDDKHRAEVAKKIGINPMMRQWLAEEMLEEAMTG